MDSSKAEFDMPSEKRDLSDHFEIFSPLSVVLMTIICLGLYMLYRKLFSLNPPEQAEYEELPRIRRDMTVAELQEFNGSQNDGRVFVAVNGWIFDVTQGRRFYGPGGPYAAFGGKDATRGLATFSVTSSDKEYDDLSDLNSMEMESIKEWEAQFREKYELVGRLLKPGEEPTCYSDEEYEETDTSTNTPTEEKKVK